MAWQWKAIVAMQWEVSKNRRGQTIWQLKPMEANCGNAMVNMEEMKRGTAHTGIQWEVSKNRQRGQTTREGNAD